MDNILDANFNEDYKEEDFQFYKSFHQQENAQEYIALLNEHKIPFLVTSSEALIDQNIVGTGLFPKVVLKVLARDFQKIAYLIEEELNHPELNTNDHYLNALNDDELMEILQQPDQWTVEDSIIAQKILEQRGKPISRERVRALKKERLEEIRQGKAVPLTTIALYFLGVIVGLFTHYIFIIAGIAMALYYKNGKSVDPDGVKYYTFNEQTRHYGQYLLYASIAVLLVELAILLKLL